MLWSVEECRRTPLDGFDPSWLPSGLPSGIATYTQGRASGIETDSIVGSIPLRNGDTLQILPKVKGLNFMRMLLEADIAAEGSIWSGEDLAHYDLSSDMSLASLVSRPFVSVLKEVQASSALFRWHKRELWSEYADGEIDVGQSIVALAQRLPKPLLVRRSHRMYDVAENRVLVAAANLCEHRFGYLLPKVDKQFLTSFADSLKVSQLNSRDLQHVEDGLVSQRYEGARGYYTAALRLAQIILGECGLDQGQERIKAQPVLFNSATVFERFVRSHLQRAYQSFRLTVRKGFFPEKYLYTDGTTLLEPDVVLLKDEQIRLVGDIKYKIEGVSSSDNHQMHAYALRGGVQCGVFFCASSEAVHTKSITRSSHLGPSIYEVHLPLGDLAVTIQSLQQLEHHVPAFHPY